MDYDTVFICGSNVTARLGKQVYIRKEYHDRIQKMLHVIGGNEVTIAAFLDNVLTHHFTLFQDEIADRSNGTWNPIIYKYPKNNKKYEKNKEEPSG